MRYRNSLLILSAMALLSGCGGHGSSSAASRSRAGHVAFTIQWPAESRYIPTSAKFVRVQIKDSGGTVVDTVEFYRGLATKDLTDTQANKVDLTGGVEYTLSAESYSGPATPPPGTPPPLATPTGNPLSSGTEKVTVVADATTTKKVVLASELDSFKVDLTDLTTGASVGTGYTIKPGAPAPSPLPTIKTTAIVGIDVVLQNETLPGSDKSLILYPATTSKTPLTTVGDLMVTKDVASNATVDGVLTPQKKFDTTATLNVTFSDTGLAPSFTANLPITQTALGATAISGVSAAGAVEDAVATDASNPAGANASYVSYPTGVGTVHNIDQYQGIVRTLFIAGVLNDSAVAAASSRVFVSEKGSNSISVYNTSGTSLGPQVSNVAVDFLAAYLGKVYAANVAGSTVTIDILTIGAFTHSSATFSTPNMVAFAVGPSPTTGGEAFYALQQGSGTLRRYVNGAQDVAFVPAVSGILSFAVDGNVIWVVDSGGATGTVKALRASDGALLDSLDMGVTNIKTVSAGSNKGIVAYGNATHQIKTFTY